MEEANGRLLWIVPISIGLIMVLLYTAFSSIKDSLLVMVNVLEASMGGVLALWITGTPFSISAAVGFVSVFGVAVQDGVLLISYFNQMRDAGLPVREAVMRGAELRVRPVVMTSLTAALGLFPAAIATSIGSQAQKPLGIVVVGAMLCTLFLTRYLMPVLYSFFPAPAGHGECQVGTDSGLPLYRPIPASRTEPAGPPITAGGVRVLRQQDPSETTTILEEPGNEDRLETRRVLIAVIARHRHLADPGSPGPGLAPVLWRHISDSAAHAGETQPSKTWIPDPSPKAPWDHPIVLSCRSGQRDRPADAPSSSSRPCPLSLRLERDHRLRPRHAHRRPVPVLQPGR